MMWPLSTVKRTTLNWFGLVAHSSGAFSQHVIYTLIEGACQGEGVQDDMEQLTENDCHEWKLNV